MITPIQILIYYIQAPFRRLANYLRERLRPVPEDRPEILALEAASPEAVRYYGRAIATLPRLDTATTVVLDPLTDSGEFGRIVGEEAGELPELVLYEGDPVTNPDAIVPDLLWDELGSWDPDAVDWMEPAIFIEVGRDALKSGALHPPIGEAEFVNMVMNRVLAVA